MIELFNFLAERKVTPNGWCQLFNMHKGLTYTNYLNTFTELTRLEQAGMVRATGNPGKGIPVSQFEITSTGLALLEDVEKLLRKKQKTDKSSTLYQEWESYIEQYRQLFPGKLNGQIYRSNAKEIYAKFVWFFDNNKDVTWDDILRITDEYIKSNTDMLGQITFLQTASNFIRKQNSDKTFRSTLSDWCELDKSKKDNPELQPTPAFTFFGETTF